MNDCYYSIYSRSNSGSSYPFVVTTSGKVGICTSAPTTALDVRGNPIHSSVPDSSLNLVLRQPTHSTSVGRERVYFQAGSSNTIVGIISTNWNGTTGSATYGSLSDYRLKEFVHDDIVFLSRFMKLRPVEYSWYGNKEMIEIGFIAHEL